MMTFTRFTTIFAAVGLLVPLIFRVVWHFLNQSTNLNVHDIAEKLMLLLWPTSLMTLPVSPEPGFETKLFLISLMTNSVFYAVLGVLIWLGLQKHASFFALASLLVIAVWWWLLIL